MLLTFTVVLVAGMNLLTVPSVSLEGEQLWQLQSLPVTPWQVLRAKLDLHLLVTLPPALLCLACGLVLLRAPWTSALLAGLLVCAVATALVKKPLRAVIIYMAYSIIMSVIWILLEAPDLALTEAAVGAGITGILFFLTLRRIDRIDRDADVEETQGEEELHEENEATH